MTEVRKGYTPRRYGAFVDVRDPDFASLRVALDHVQAQIDEVADQIDKDSVAPMVRAAYDELRQELVIRLAWTAKGKAGQKMMSPEEIKWALECCRGRSCGTIKVDCPYEGMRNCDDVLLGDALALIRQLEAGAGDQAGVDG